MHLETQIKNMLGETPESMKPEARFDVIAFELWRESEGGWSVNDAWKIAQDTDIAGVLTAARGRWEVFKVNYSPRATVHGLTSDGDESTLIIESGGNSFLEIRLLDDGQ